MNNSHALPPSGYYMPGMEDRLLVEKLLNTCLVPYNLESADRMKKLFLLFATIDENASKAFIEVQTKQVGSARNISLARSYIQNHGNLIYGWAGVRWKELLSHNVIPLSVFERWGRTTFMKLNQKLT